MACGKKSKRGRKAKKKVDDEVEFVCTWQPVIEGEEGDLDKTAPGEVDKPGTEPEEGEQLETEQAEDEQHDTEQAEVEQHVIEQDHHNVQETEEHSTVPEPVESSSRKRKRGPTMMKDIAKDPNSRVHVDFTFMGEPYGPGSVKLSSYLGPLVREHIPVTLESWKKLTEDVKTVLWKSVQVTVSIQKMWRQFLSGLLICLLCKCRQGLKLMRTTKGL